MPPLLLCLASPVLAALKLASPFTDHAVLQRELALPVWGMAEGGSMVTVEFAGQRKTAEATPGGAWRVTFDPLEASAEPRELSVVARLEGKEEGVRLKDVLVGEVWLASGQSNMDFTLAKTEKYYFAGVSDEAAEVAAAEHPLIRMFTGEWARGYEPKAEVPGSWKICTPGNAREFSAVGYYFARELREVLDVPVGIVTLTYGASCAQAWIRREAIAADPRLRPLLEKFDAEVRTYQPPSEGELAAWRAAADQAKVEGKRPPRRPRPDPVQDQHNPTVMFNGMIAPVIPFAIRGVIWYQGESITAPRELFPRWNETLIADWRALWGRELPFYFVQLAAHRGGDSLPQVRAWQAEALQLPGTGMAVAIDVGDPTNVHPRNKAPVGRRLALLALNRTYGKAREDTGPQFAALTREAGALRVAFTHADGLVARGGPPNHFEIAAADGRFHPAEAAIDGTTVLLTAPGVATPVAVRYAWSPYPENCNVYNSAGLPAVPFLAGLPP